MLRTIRSRLMIVISVMVIALVSASSWFAYNYGEEVIMEMAVSNASQLVQTNAEVIFHQLQAIRAQVMNLADTDAIKLMDWDQQQPIFERILSHEDYIEAFMVADLSGDYQTTIGETGNIKDRKYFNQAISNNETVISEPVISRATGKPIIVVASPIIKRFTEDQVIGIVAATIELTFFQELIVEMNINGNGYGWIINSGNKVVVHPDGKYIGNNLLLDEGGEGLKRVVSAMQEEGAGIAFYQLNGEERLLAYNDVALTDWKVVLEVKSKELYAALQDLKNGSWMISLIAILFGLIIAGLIARYITAPILAVLAELKRLAQGDLRVNISKKYINRKDEIGVLAKQVEEMVINLQETVKQVQDVSDSVVQSSKGVEYSVEQIGKTAEQVGASIQNVASGAVEQSSQVEETAENMKLLNDEIEDIKSSSIELAKRAEEVSQEIERGYHSVKESVNKVKKVRDNTDRIAAEINELGEYSQEIGEIVSLISSIAEQTDLLALNAAIEAARAGEAGRGFNVVADEIRKLAEESANATENISSLIKEIKTGITDAVEQMKEGTTDVNSSVTSIQETGKIFEGIQQMIVDLKTTMEMIKERTVDMNLKSQTVGQAINEIAVVSEDFAQTSEEVAAASEEQIASTEEIISLTHELADKSKKMEETVNKFKI